MLSFREVLGWGVRSYRHILKWDESKIHRNPRGAPNSTGGQFSRAIGSSVAPGMERGGGSGGMEHAPQQHRYPFGNAPDFKNPPRFANMPERLRTPSEAEQTREALTHGEVETVHKKFSGGINATYHVEMDDENQTEAVFKPEVGETWHTSFTNDDISQYITNKEFSLAEREAMASEISRGLGFEGLVPETQLRESLDVPGVENVGSDDDDDEIIWDSRELREMYDEYREKNQEAAYEAANEEMYELFSEAQREHVGDIQNRAEEVTEIWNTLVDEEFPDETPYGHVEILRAHPTLPLGSKGPFERRQGGGVVDPLEVLDEANVDVESKLSEKEAARVKEILRKHLQEGNDELGDVDEEAAREHLEYGDWVEGHADTEGRLIDKHLKSYESWKEEQGYNQGDGGGGGGARNKDAPHPNGGSLQHFIPRLSNDGDMSHEDATKMAVLDYVLGSMDRHGNNIKFKGDTPVAIDNGYSMPGPSQGPDDFAFRSVAVAEWMSDARHRSVPDPFRDSVLKSMNDTDWEAMADRHPSMSDKERTAFLGRVERMKEALSYAGGLSTLWHDQELMRY